jgi:hypothetical protein
LPLKRTLRRAFLVLFKELRPCFEVLVRLRQGLLSLKRRDYQCFLQILEETLREVIACRVVLVSFLLDEVLGTITELLALHQNLLKVKYSSKLLLKSKLALLHNIFGSLSKLLAAHRHEVLS